MAIQATFERVASINPTQITDQGSKKRVQPHVINIICLASDSALNGTFVRNERLTIRIRYVCTSPCIIDHFHKSIYAIVQFIQIQS